MLELALQRRSVSRLGVALLLYCISLRTVVAWDSPETASPREEAAPLFEQQVKGILKAHCGKCHGLESRKAGLDVRSVPFLRRGGDSGPALVTGKSAQSILYQRIEDRSMPPEGELPLTDKQIASIRKWIEAGAATKELSEKTASDVPPISEEDRNYWAFQKPVRPKVPEVATAERRRNDIDAFLLEKLEARSLGFSPEADRRTIATRLYLDLIGLPPTPEEVDAFVGDLSQDPYGRLVDRLLNSQHFGERWGRHWLDMVGYADTIGDDTDATITKLGQGKWRYRDYVIKSFNDDKPYDRFLTEQFAGDELFDWRKVDSFTEEQRELLIATGFLRTAADETLQKELNTADIRHAVLQHSMESSLTGVLGLTIKCARCHTHKYDPIPQEDYYRLLAVFTPAYNPQSWLEPSTRQMVDVSPAHKKRIDAHNGQIDQSISECQTKLDALRGPVKARLLDEKLKTVPEDVRDACKIALATAAEKRDEKQKQLVAQYGEKLKVSIGEIRAALDDAKRAQDSEMQQRINSLTSQKKSWGTIQALYDVAAPPPTYLLRRGNYETPGH